MKRSALLLCAAIAASSTCVTAQATCLAACTRTHHSAPLAQGRSRRACKPVRLKSTPPSPLTTSSPVSRSFASATSPVPHSRVYAPKRQCRATAQSLFFQAVAIRILAIDLEGTEVCDWLNSIDVTCVLVKYRVPNTGPYPKSAAALQDAQRALGIVRQHAAEWHIDPSSRRRSRLLRRSASFRRTQHPLRQAPLRPDRCRRPAQLPSRLRRSSSIPDISPMLPKTWRPMQTSIPPTKLRPASSFRQKMTRCTSKTPPSTSCN